MKENHNSNRIDNPICPYQVENDIELNRIWDAIKMEWRVCLLIVIVFIAFSVVLSILLPKQYLAESILLPPTDISVNRLNIPEYFKLTSTEKNFQLTGEKIYLLFLDNLRSSELRHQFFNENNLIEKLRKKDEKYIDDEDIFTNKFNKKINIEYTHGNDGDTKFIKVELFGDDPLQVSGWLNKYINLVDRETVKSIEDSIKTKISVEKDSVTETISSLRVVAEKNRQDTIDKIIEDLKIAEQLNIIEPANVSFSYYSQAINSDTGVIVNSNETPGYLKGANILRAELNSVKNRRNNDPFIPGLGNLLEREEYLGKVLKLPFNNVHAARIDKRATPPVKPAKPIKIIVIAVGAFFGVLISTFFILIKISLNKGVGRNSKA